MNLLARHRSESKQPISAVLATLLGAARVLSVAVCALAVVAVLLVAPVAAQDAPNSDDPLDCDAPVVDVSGEVDVDSVLAALGLVNPEATVIIRSFDSVPDADLVAAIDDVVVACFGDENSGIRPDVIVLGLSVGDRLSDVLIGGKWATAVPDPNRLRADFMGPRFSQDDFTGGLVVAIEEIAFDIDRQLLSVPRQNDTEPDQSDELDLGQDDIAAGSTDTGSTDNTGTDNTDNAGTGSAATDDAGADQPGGGQSPWAIAGGVLGLGACGGVFYFVNRQRQLGSARAEYERSSAAPMVRLGALRERDNRLIAQADVWSKTSADRTLVELRSLLREATSGRTSVEQASSLLIQAMPDGLENASYQAISRGQDRLVELSRSLDTQDECLDRLAGFGAHLDHLRVALPAKAELLDEEIDEALAMAEQRDSEGWSIESQSKDLHQLGDVIDGLDFNRLELDLLGLSERIESAEAQLFATNHYLQSLPSRVESLKKWNSGLEAAVDMELRRIDDLRRQFALVASTHATDSWHWAADYPQQAFEEIQLAEGMQDHAISEMISNHRFDEAGEQLDHAGLQLMVADRLLDQVDDLMIDLDRAVDEAPRLIDQCAEVLQDLDSYVDRFGKDLEPAIVSAPRELASAIDGLRSELRQKKPNYLRVAETGDRVSRQIDQLLAVAEDQHLRMESLRRELSREIARANRSLARAQRSLGWELFKSGDGRALDSLAEALANLPSDMPDAITAAAGIADDALRVQERIIARRRRSSVWVNTGGGDWRSGGGGWSSGRSSSGGSFGAGSGGRSFGGQSSSGGRSFGGGRSSGSF